MRPPLAFSGTGPKVASANANITCLDCHLVQPGDQDVAQGHEKYYSRSDMPWGEAKYKMPIAAIVTPKDCSRCHPDEATQYSKSKHANTIEIMWKLDPWLNNGMNSENERKVGCLACHGTEIKIDDKGKIDPDTWPNVGVGRLNLDGSKGSCTSCHTRHRFSVAEARMPEACDSCHLGPDHPQIEIFEESKHGTIYNAFKDEYNFDAAGGTWTAGRGLPCTHLCGLPHVRHGQRTHQPRCDRSGLSWETQAPLTVRPQDFKPFPSGTNWQDERRKMQNVCSACHSESWISDFYNGFDKAVEEYNDVYFKPAKAKRLTNSTRRGFWTRPSILTSVSRSSTMSCGTTKAAGRAWAP